MAAANSMGLVPAARTSKNALYHNPCPQCGKVRLSRIGRLGSKCHQCATALRGGLSKHPLYRLLWGARSRCEAKNHPAYPYYGGRGITVCDEWKNDPASFMVWALTHGYAKGLDLDRIDNDGPYAPWNCQFISHAKNMRKKRQVLCDERMARAVKAALARGQSSKAIAGAYGLTYTIVWQIKTGRTWKDA